MPILPRGPWAWLGVWMLLQGVAFCDDNSYVRAPGRSHPRVYRFDARKDEFKYYENVFSYKPPPPPAEDDVRFYGNRLTQYRYLGSRKTSGIYGALQGYKEKGEFDSSKYQYRWR